MSDTMILRLLIGYVAAGVAAFGPAMVESERAADAALAACLARVERYRCEDARSWAPTVSGSFLKAAAWPAWLSYQAALAISARQAAG